MTGATVTGIVPGTLAGALDNGDVRLILLAVIALALCVWCLRLAFAWADAMMLAERETARAADYAARADYLAEALAIVLTERQGEQDG